MTKLSKILLISILGFCNFAQGEESLKVTWPAGRSAVAWMTKKRMFLIKNVEPVGLNTSISIFKDDDKKTISIRIPINKFDSGEPDRDKDVVRILKGNIQPDLLFTSDAVNDELEKNIMQDQFSGRLSGQLKIGGQSFPVTFNVKKTKDSHGDLLEGELATTFTAFEIEPPTVAGGLVAKVRDDLTLLFRIYLIDIKK